MKFSTAFRWSAWGGHEGQNGTAECQHDGPGGCGWFVGGITVRAAKREAENHLLQTGHIVMVERTLWAIVSPVEGGI